MNQTELLQNQTDGFKEALDGESSDPGGGSPITGVCERSKADAPEIRASLTACSAYV